MPVITVGIAEVEERLRLVRRRLNSLTLQHALYLSSGLALLAAAVLVTLALRGGTWVFRLGFWAASGAFVASSVYAVLRIRQKWLSLAQVARLADRRAQLDDRLSTLIADRAQRTNSRLKGLLLAQVMVSTTRWDVQAIAPQRVPRSLFFLISSLAVLLATAFYARPPVRPEPPVTAQHPGRLSGETEPVRLFRPPRPDSVGSRADFSDAGAGRSADNGAGEQPLRSGNEPAAAPEADNLRVASASSQAVPEQRPGETKSGARDNHPQAQPPEPGEGTAEKLQTVIRDALGGNKTGQSFLRLPQEVDPDLAGSRRSTSDQAAGPAGESGTGTTQHRSTSDRPDESRRQEDSRPNVPPSETRKGQSPGGAGAGRDSGAEASGGLFAKQTATGTAQQGNAHPLALKLGSFAASTTTRAEPQRKEQPAVPAVGVPGLPAPAPQLSEEQSPDAPLQKAAVSPEHEALVRRIFTRYK